MPKCSVRPYQAAREHRGLPVRREERRLTLHRGVVAPGQVGRAAPQFRQHRGQGVQHLPGRGPGGQPLGVGREAGQRAGPAVRQPARGQPVQQRGALRAGRRPGGERGVPLGVQLLAPVGHLAGVRHGLLLGREAHRRVEAEDLLGLGHLVRAERGAVRRAGVLRVRGGPGDDGAQHDQRRLRGLRLGIQVGLVEGLGVLVVAARRQPVHPLHVPAVCLVPGRDILRLGDLGVVLDRDVVVVVEHGEVAEFLHRGQRGGLVGDALLDVAVRAERVDVVVERAGPGGGVRVEQAALAARGHGHADRVGQARAERPGGGLHAGGEPVLRVARGDAAPLPVVPEVVQGQPVTGQVELDVQGQAGMPAGQHEPVPAEPARVGRVVPEDVLVEEVGRRGQAHRRARVAVAGLLHRVHGQDPDQIDGPLVGSRPVQGTRRWAAHGGIRAPLWPASPGWQGAGIRSRA